MYYYWPYANGTPSSSSYWNSPISSGTTWVDTSRSNSTATNGFFYYVSAVVREFLIIEPECWSDQNAADFTRLVNNETKTGFKITLRIKGEVQIADPNVEVRTMENFVPLLLSYAGSEDHKKIVDFFSAHPCKAEA